MTLQRGVYSACVDMDGITKCDVIFCPYLHRLTVSCISVPLIHGGNDDGDTFYELRALFCYCMLVII